VSPPFAEVLPDELLPELQEDSPNKFKTICSLLFGLRLKVICCPSPGSQHWNFSQCGRHQRACCVSHRSPSFSHAGHLL